jgi:Glycine-zipper domain
MGEEGVLEITLAASRITFPMLLLAASGLAACAGPKPVLYPNQHLEAVGQARAERDIAECQALAESAGARAAPDRGARTAGSTAVGGAAGAATGVVGGAVVGSPGTGAAVGAATGATAGLLRSIFSSRGPSAAYQGFVDRCLRERGYEPVGWD